MPGDPEGRLVEARRIGWAPRPLPKPEVDPALTELHPVIRAGEVLRYSAARFEYWVSPGGRLREVVRLSLLAASLLALPVLLVMPLLTLLLTEFCSWTDLIARILFNLAAIAFALALAHVLIRMPGKKGP